jgi:hypothetical protein
MDAIDTLFSILPFAFALIWILSRVGRARKNSGDSARKPSGGNSTEQAASRQAPEKAPASGSVAEWVAEKAKRVRDAAAEAPIRKTAPRGEEELYARLEKRRVEAAGPRIAASAGSEGATKRMVSDAVSPYRTDREASGPSPLARIATLPPLAQGVLWSEILGEPPALKGPWEF